MVFRGIQVGQVAKVEALYDPKKTTIKRLGLDPTYPELPTVPTEIERLLDNVRQTVAELGKLPLEALLSEVLGLIKRVNTLLEVPDLKQALMSLNDLVRATQQLLKDADGQVAPLGSKLAAAADSARAALEAARVAMVDAQKLFRDVDGQVAPLASSAKETLTTARGTLGQAQESLSTLTDAATPALKQGEEHTLKAIEEAAWSIRILADSLQHNPESLLRGKGR